MPNRRDFLAQSTLLGFGSTVPAFLGRTAYASPALGSLGAADTVLVVVQLTGGNDGLNTVVPYTDPLYKKYRPTLALSRDQVARLDDSIGLHNSLAPLAELHKEGFGCVVQNVGYPNPSQSHFEAMDTWQTGSTATPLPSDGWLGRAMHQAPLTGFHLVSDQNDAAPLALAGAPVRAASLTKLSDYQLHVSAATTQDRKRQEALMQSTLPMASAPSAGKPGLLDFVRKTATDTYATSDRIKAIGQAYESTVPYHPTPLGEQFKLAAQLIQAGVSARLLYISQFGYDTHVGQGGEYGNHAILLNNLASSLAAFLNDLKKRQVLDRVCVLVFSEFGRRVAENGGAGTDHGAAAPVLLYGGKLQGGILGSAPNLEKLNDGNLVHQIDFRQIYASILNDWLRVDAQRVLGQKFEPLPLFRGGVR